MQDISSSSNLDRKLPLESKIVSEYAQFAENLDLNTSINHMLSLQRSDGYWWFSLEANEQIGAEFIMLMHFIECVDETTQAGIARRILDVQREDGSWSLSHKGKADLSTSIECYFALKLAGFSPDDPALQKARAYILSAGGIEKARIFTKIHLAWFGQVPWWACPSMPVELILLPDWFPINIYEFSSWARASIVPLLIILSLRPLKVLDEKFHVDELYVNSSENRDFSYKTDKGKLSPENLFIYIDKFLKFVEKTPLKPLRKLSLKKAKTWIWDHVEKVEDIYPALANAVIAYHTLGYAVSEPEIQKPLDALKMFQQHYIESELPSLPDEVRDDGEIRPSELRQRNEHISVSATSSWKEHKELDHKLRVHQQCCVSPVWDTPWMIVALLEAGVPSDHPALLKTGRWLLKKQITEIKGDWAVKCKKDVEPGGWSFEFENDFFPDVDDTIEVLHVLKQLKLPQAEKKAACDRALNWLLAMQNKDGGWGAFDTNNDLELLNKIPFSDHGACLDPSTPDITGRMIELLLTYGFSQDAEPIRRGVDYLKRTQESFGAWFARWGVNYIYGTWAVLTAFSMMDDPSLTPLVEKATTWLHSIQNEDGGFSESTESYYLKQFVPCPESTASQTGWALMALIASDQAETHRKDKAARYLSESRNEYGAWDEEYHTGTGFPGHFYIRYHGYRHYFPLLALAKYKKSKQEQKVI